MMPGIYFYMSADKCEDISSLVTMIKDQILVSSYH